MISSVCWKELRAVLIGHDFNKESPEDRSPAVLRHTTAALNGARMKLAISRCFFRHVLNTLHVTVSTCRPHTSGINKTRANNEWHC